MLSSDARSDNVREIFTEISEKVGALPDPHIEPDRYIIDLYSIWKYAGGKKAGKTKHSIRFLDENIKSEGSVVRSLTPKLTGETRFRPRDGFVLVKYMLSNWPATSGKSDEYEELLASGKILTAAEFIESSLTGDRSVMTKNEESKEAEAPTLWAPAGETAVKIIVNNYKECDALIAMSPEHLLINKNHAQEIVGFLKMMDALYGVYRETQARRPIIWGLDVGDRRVDDYHGSNAKFVSLHTLRMRLKALQEYNDTSRDEKWRWITSDALVIVFDSSLSRTKNSKVEPVEYRKSEILMEQIPMEWARDANLHALYGTNFERLDSRTFSVFFSQAQRWPSGEDLRYFAYASFKIGESVHELMGLELPVLPRQYEDGFRTLCAAAKQVLGLEKFASEASPREREQLVDLPSGKTALEQLNNLGADVLTIDEFLGRF